MPDADRPAPLSPRTAAGKRLLTMLERDFESVSFPNALDDILDIEAEQRAMVAAGLNEEVERVVAERELAPAPALDATPRLTDWAKWITVHELPGSDGDWACAECRPYSDMLIAGFRCTYHEAKAYLAAEDGFSVSPKEPPAS